MSGKLDLEAARRLAAEIQANLASLPVEDAKYRELRAEMDALDAILASADAPHPETQTQIRSVRGALKRAATELQADGIRASVFLAELGRILGLD